MAKITRKQLLEETIRLHDLSVGEKHCDPTHIRSCPLLIELMPQAADNIKARLREKYNV